MDEEREEKVIIILWTETGVTEADDEVHQDEVNAPPQFTHTSVPPSPTQQQEKDHRPWNSTYSPRRGPLKKKGRKKKTEHLRGEEHVFWPQL